MHIELSLITSKKKKFSAYLFTNVVWISCIENSNKVTGFVFLYPYFDTNVLHVVSKQNISMVECTKINFCNNTKIFLKQHMAVIIGMLNLNLYNMRSARAVLHTRYNLFSADDDFVKDMLLYEFANPFATQHNNENVVFVLLLLK